MNAPVDASLNKYSVETLLSIHRWTPKLLSFHLSRQPGFRFVAGQFARLGIAAAGAEVVWRAYSMSSAPYADHLEFYSIIVPGGAFSERLAQLSVGDELLVEKSPYGFLTADRFVDDPAYRRDLWLLASGTGIAPFVSMLLDPETWARFEHVVVVHSVRAANELAYRQEIAELPGHPLIGPLLGSDPAARLRYVPIVTREPGTTALAERITVLIADGRLESAAAMRLDTERSRIMVCGNPQMARDVRAALVARDFRVNRRQQPGHMAFENYW